MSVRLVAIILLPVFFSCRAPESTRELEQRNAVLIDSFEVSGITIGQQVQNFHYVNGETLYSFNEVYREMNIFRRLPDSATFALSERCPIETEPFSSVFEDSASRKYFISRSNIITVYDSALRMKESVKRIHHRFQSLKDSFCIIASHHEPALVENKTLVSFFAQNHVEAYDRQFAEDAIAEFDISKDSVSLKTSYIPRPPSLRHHYAPYPKYCFVENTIYLVYPGIDSIYRYDRNTHQLGVSAINNKDYSTPGSFDLRDSKNPDYFPQLTKYSIKTFSYDAFYYDPQRQLFYLFYYPPVSDTIRGRLPTLQDKSQSILVLDKHLKPLRYTKIPQKDKGIAAGYFYIPGKGFAVPMVKDLEHFERTKFYVYQF